MLSKHVFHICCCSFALQQCSHTSVASLQCQLHGSTSLTVERIKLSTMTDKQVDHLNLSVHSSDVKRSHFPLTTSGVDIDKIRFQQGMRNWLRPVKRSLVKRCPKDLIIWYGGMVFKIFDLQSCDLLVGHLLVLSQIEIHQGQLVSLDRDAQRTSQITLSQASSRRIPQRKLCTVLSPRAPRRC